MREASRIISLDIDGVLTDYPACWLAYLNQAMKTSFKTREEARAALGDKGYDEQKDAYRISEYKANLPMKSGAKEFCDALTQCGYDIWISTSRLPVSHALTKRWLKKNNISYKAFVQKPKVLDESFVNKLSGITMHVDDEGKNVAYLIAHGVPAILLSANGGAAGEELLVARSYKNILAMLSV